MISFYQQDYPFFDYGGLQNADEAICVLHCLLTDCVTVAFGLNKECWFKSKGGGSNLGSNTARNTYLKAAFAGCVHGYSCYALLTYQNGQNKAKARKHCRDAGGHLVEFDGQDELDAVKADGRFGVLRAPLWIGVHYTAGQWQGEKSGSVMTVLPWLINQPASTDEGTSVILNPLNSSGFATAANSETAFPFCELSAITMTNRGQSMNHLNDGDLTTCFTPQTPSEAAGPP